MVNTLLYFLDRLGFSTIAFHSLRYQVSIAYILYYSFKISSKYIIILPRLSD